MFDVKSVFLNAKLEIPMYLEWPKSMKELGFINKKEEEEQCIKLVRSMYGNVDAALRWNKAFIKLCTDNEIGCIQSQADPCILYKRNKTGELQLIVALYVDNVLISGNEKEIYMFKTKFKQTYKITDLGNLKKHIGIWYKWIKKEEGSTIKMHMDDMVGKSSRDVKSSHAEQEKNGHHQVTQVP